MPSPSRDQTESKRRQQFTVLWLKVQPVVAAYISAAIRDRQHSEDILQDTALAIAEAFDTYDPARPFLPWAIGVARNKLLGYYRNHGSDRLVFDGELLSQIGSRFEAEAESLKEKYSMLERCLERLAGHARAMLEMRYQRDMSYEQIAQSVGRTSAGVANNLYRSRKALADCVRQEMAREHGGLS